MSLKRIVAFGVSLSSWQRMPADAVLTIWEDDEAFPRKSGVRKMWRFWGSGVVSFSRQLDISEVRKIEEGVSATLEDDLACWLDGLKWL